MKDILIDLQDDDLLDLHDQSNIGCDVPLKSN